MKRTKTLREIDTGLSSLQKAALGALRLALDERLGGRLKRFALYGSRARGDYEVGSDVDVAIVVKGLGRAERMGLLDMVSRIEIEMAESIAALVMSEDEFMSLKRRGRRLARDIINEGVPL